MGRTSALIGLVGAFSCWAAGCTRELAPASDSHPRADAGRAEDVDASSMRPALCERAGDDAVRDVFCADAPSSIGSLLALRMRLGLDIPEPSPDNTLNPFGYNPASDSRVFVVLLAHSTALTLRLVSPINPRVILMTDGLFMTFTRGVQQVELVGRDRSSGRLNFYLLRFEQACNAAHGGCTIGDRFTSRIESDWTRVSLRDAEELKNTRFDCRQCHQRGRDEPVLLMRELNAPWTHFFDRVSTEPNPFPEPTGGDLMRDFLAAHGDESYAALSSPVLRTAHAFTLRDFADYKQPLLFDGLKIQRERWPQGPDGYADAPARSATWQHAYDAFKRGEQLALPYFAQRVSDPDKQQRLTAAYRRVLDADAGARAWPDLADVFPDDPQTRAEIGLQVEPEATPAQALVQACSSCHADVLDQHLSRARFNIAIGRLDRAELDTAVARLRADRGAEGAMPPPEARQLDERARKRLIAYLEQSSRPLEDEQWLEHAARAEHQR